MFGLGATELVLILVVVLLIFGPRKLPELGAFLGKSLRDFRDALDRRGAAEDDSGAQRTFLDRDPPAREAPPEREKENPQP
jgi:sec-independent protein translocase protein TatA